MEEGQDGGEIYLLDLMTNYVVSELVKKREFDQTVKYWWLMKMKGDEL